MTCKVISECVDAILVGMELIVTKCYVKKSDFVIQEVFIIYIKKTVRKIKKRENANARMGQGAIIARNEFAKLKIN